MIILANNHQWWISFLWEKSDWLALYYQWVVGDNEINPSVVQTKLTFQTFSLFCSPPPPPPHPSSLFTSANSVTAWWPDRRTGGWRAEIYCQAGDKSGQTWKETNVMFSSCSSFISCKEYLSASTWPSLWYYPDVTSPTLSKQFSAYPPTHFHWR